MRNCPECQENIADDKINCPVCGAYSANGHTNSDYRDLLIALLISLIGWGCFYHYGVEIFIDRSTYFYRILTIHWICRLVALVFFWASTYLIIKYSRYRQEKRDFALFSGAVVARLIRQGITEENIESVIESIKSQLGDKKFPQFSRSLVFTRFAKTIEFLKSVPQRNEIHDILSYRAELDIAAVQSQFSIIKIFAWVMPILGFIGTVLGISEAIKGFSVNVNTHSINAAVPQDFSTQIMQGLNSVTGGLTTAFDTTYIALILVIPITFAVGFLEKSYDDYLNFLENYFLSAVVPHLLIGRNSAINSENANQSLNEIEELSHRWKNLIAPSVDDLKDTADQLNSHLKVFTQAVAEFNRHLLIQQNNQTGN